MLHFKKISSDNGLIAHKFNNHGDLHVKQIVDFYYI